MISLDVRLVASQADAQFCSRLAGGLKLRGHRVVVDDSVSVAPGPPGKIVHAASLTIAAACNAATDIISCRGAELELFDLELEATQAKLRHALAVTRFAHCASRDVAERVRALAGERLPIRVAPPGAVATAPSAKRSGALKIVCHGPMTWLSGFDYLLAALARVRASGTPFEAIIFGEGELLAPMRFSCGDLGLGDDVRFPGHARLAEIREALGRADVFVVTSHYETIHETAVEAMALGVPVIATRVGGMSDLVRDRQDGILVEPRDIEGLANAIIGLERERAQQLGDAARAHIAEAFSADAEIDAVEAMYRELQRDHA